MGKISARKAEDWDLEANVEKLERAASSSLPENESINRARLGFLDDDDLETALARAEESPEHGITERRAEDRRVADRRLADRRAQDSGIEEQGAAKTSPDLVGIVRSAIEAAHAATNAARRANDSARAATDEAAIHAQRAREADRTATIALITATTTAGATVALAIGLVVMALLLR